MLVGVRVQDEPLATQLAQEWMVCRPPCPPSDFLCGGPRKQKSHAQRARPRFWI